MSTGVVHDRFGMPLRASGSTAVEVALDRDTSIVDLRVWDAIHGKVRFVKARQGREYAISPDRQRFASYPGGDGQPLAVFDSRTGAALASFGRWGFGLHAITFSPDGRRLLAAKERNRSLDDQPPHTAITLVDAATGAHAVRLASRVALARVTAVSFSQDGLLVAAATEEHAATGKPRVALWDASTGRQTWTVEVDTRISAVAVSPVTGHVVAAANDRTLRVHERTTGREIGRLLGHTSRVTALGFVGDAPRLASAGDDGTVRFWDVATASPLLTLRASGPGAVTSEFRLRGPTVHRVDQVPGLAFSEDGSEIVFASLEQDSDGVLVRFTVWSGARRTEVHGR